MARVVSLYLPFWPTDRQRRESAGASLAADMPLALIGRQGAKRVITAVNSAARTAGLRPGMPVSKAQALVPSLVTMKADPAADIAGLERLALWALRFYAPIVAADPPDGLVIDTTGADHLHGNEMLMITGIINRLYHVGVTARAAVADTWGAAHALARFGTADACVAESGQMKNLLLNLPVAALRLSPDIISDLWLLGFKTIGDLTAAPRAPLTLRFGLGLGQRLDQALGMRPEPIHPVHEPQILEAKRFFAEPIGAPETIARVVAKLVLQLCTILTEKSLGARRLDLILYRVDNSLQAIRIGTAQPGRDINRLTRLLSDRIETIDPGFGIESMVLKAVLIEPWEPFQQNSSLLEEHEPDVSGLWDILSNRFGARQLYRIGAFPSDVPERAIVRLAATAPETKTAWPTQWPRPVRLLARPESIETLALLPDHPPVSFTWRGTRFLVSRADGPERIFGEWWKRDAELEAVRDYFTVETATGERYWIYRAGDGEHQNTGSHRWFMHGFFG